MQVSISICFDYKTLECHCMYNWYWCFHKKKLKVCLYARWPPAKFSYWLHSYQTAPNFIEYMQIEELLRYVNTDGQIVRIFRFDGTFLLYFLCHQFTIEFSFNLDLIINKVSGFVVIVLYCMFSVLMHFFYSNKKFVVVLKMIFLYMVRKILKDLKYVWKNITETSVSCRTLSILNLLSWIAWNRIHPLMA